MGISEDRMPTWTPGFGAMGSLEEARIVLWHGFCSVHKRFTPQQISDFRTEHPDGLVVVHPECPKETVELADANGSTQYIRNYVNQQAAGAAIAIGTENNMVPDWLRSIRTNTSSALMRKFARAQPCT